MKPWTLLDKLLWRFMRWATQFIIGPLKKMGLTPNQVTTISSVANFTLAAICFAQGDYKWILAGLFFLLLHSYFDFADGSLARATGQTSDLGGWLDPRLDVIGSEAVTVGIAIGVVRLNPGMLWLSIAGLALFGRMGSLSIVFDYHRSIYGKTDFIKKFNQDKKMTLIDKAIKEFITLKSFPVLFFGTYRYLLPIVVLINQLKWLLLFTAVFVNLRWIIMFWAYAWTFDNRKTNLRVIKLLRRYVFPKNPQKR
ncbi:CDP-alcohol phosphatidyltransferase family protein [Patescibacteria group bacterium]